MRIVTWNCNMALHRKLPALLGLRPDVTIIPECARPEILQEKCPLLLPPSFVWTGQLATKGLGVFGFGECLVEQIEPTDPLIRHVLPVRVTTPELTFNLLAVWAFNNSGGVRKDEVGPLLLTVQRYRHLLTDPSTPAVIAGDLNNHLCFDRLGKLNNHANLVARLNELGLVSAYHHARGIEQGQEPEPTHYWRDRRKDGLTYHLDYCFIPRHWAAGLRSVELGAFEDWIALSDHMPLVMQMIAAEDW